jgi:hypothetical protein
MNSNQTKGIVFIVVGIVAFFMLIPLFDGLFRFLDFYSLRYLLYTYSWIKYVVGIALIVIGVKTLNATPTDEDLTGNSQILNLPTADIASNNRQINRIVKVTLSGGLIGLLAASPISSLNKKVIRENSQGWEVVQILPDTHLNLLIAALRIIILFFTLFIYTTASGYYIVLKRK